MLGSICAPSDACRGQEVSASPDFSAPESLGYGTSLHHIFASLLCSLHPGSVPRARTVLLVSLCFLKKEKPKGVR